MSLGLMSASAYFRLEDSDDIGHRLALSGVILPASLNHLPHTIGELSVIRSTRSTSLHHRIDPRNLALVGERNLSGKNLVPFRLRVCPDRFVRSMLTSQARIANAYTSLAVVGLVLANRKR